MVRHVEALAVRLIDRVVPKATAAASCGYCTSASCNYTCCLDGFSTRWMQCCWGGASGTSCQCTFLDYC